MRGRGEKRSQSFNAWEILPLQSLYCLSGKITYLQHLYAVPSHHVMIYTIITIYRLHFQIPIKMADLQTGFRFNSHDPSNKPANSLTCNRWHACLWSCWFMWNHLRILMYASSVFRVVALKENNQRRRCCETVFYTTVFLHQRVAAELDKKLHPADLICLFKMENKTPQYYSFSHQFIIKKKVSDECLLPS